MLTDIFSERYSERVLWTQVSPLEARLLNQCHRIIAEQIFAVGDDGKLSAGTRAKWQTIHDQLCGELGIQSLSPLGYHYEMRLGTGVQTHWQAHSIETVCKNFLIEPFSGKAPDKFMRERISFVELAFRLREQDVTRYALTFDAGIAEAKKRNEVLREKFKGLNLPGVPASQIEAEKTELVNGFSAAVNELNERFRQAKSPLNYHNGFIQIETDAVVQEQVEKPFWALVSNPLWENVDKDMKHALDIRDSGGPHPAFHAAKALESTIKIIVRTKQLGDGKETTASKFIDTLSSPKWGAYVTEWEAKSLRQFFSNVRNELGHGAGTDQMIELTPQQTNWAIEFCMSWIKSLVTRM